MPATLLSISAFAKKTGLSRQTLIYYDRLGVLPCYQRQENGYAIITLIRSFRQHAYNSGNL